jgi:hypothetical protein
LREGDALPADIVALARCQAVRIRHYSFDTDLFALLDELRRLVPTLAQRMGWPNAVAEGEPVLYRVARDPGPDCMIGVMPGSISREQCAGRGRAAGRIGVVATARAMVTAALAYVTDRPRTPLRAIASRDAGGDDAIAS